MLVIEGKGKIDSKVGLFEGEFYIDVDEKLLFLISKKWIVYNYPSKILATTIIIENIFKHLYV